MQNYFEIPEIIFNKKELQQLYTNNKNEWASYGISKNSSLYTQYVSLDNTVIASILNKFNNLDIVENIKFFKTLAKGYVPSHTDKRKVAINIPVVVDNKSCVVFYEKTKNFDIPKITVGDKVQDTNAKRFKKSIPNSKRRLRSFRRFKSTSKKRRVHYYNWSFWMRKNNHAFYDCRIE